MNFCRRAPVLGCTSPCSIRNWENDRSISGQVGARSTSALGKKSLESRGNNKGARSKSYLSDASQCCAECGELGFPRRPDIRSKFCHLNKLARSAIVGPVIPAKKNNGPFLDKRRAKYQLKERRFLEGELAPYYNLIRIVKANTTATCGLDIHDQESIVGLLNPNVLYKGLR